MRIRLNAALCTAAMTLFTPMALAHGGQYLGPRDVTPQPPGGGNGGGGRTPGSANPTTPTPSGPRTPTPNGPRSGNPGTPNTGNPTGQNGPRGPQTGPRGMPIEADLEDWFYWWEFNKAPYLALRESIHSARPVSGSEGLFAGMGDETDKSPSLAPSDSDKRERILPALKAALDGTDQRDIISSCLIAMAKVGMAVPDKGIEPLVILREHLVDLDQEIQETAAVSLGIYQDPAAMPDLLALVSDSPIGRKLTGNRGSISDRTRSFAAYGLGLLAGSSSDLDLKASAFDALKAVLQDRTEVSRDLRVAAIHGIRLLKLDPRDEAPKSAALLGEALAALDAYYDQDLGAGTELLQAHVPIAIATLLGNGELPDGLQARRIAYLESYRQQLQHRVKGSNHVTRSCVLAIGQMSGPVGREAARQDTPDAANARALLDYAHTGKDRQAGFFAMLSLGQMGGAFAKNQLLKIAAQGNDSHERPWAAMGLGVMEHNRIRAAEERGMTAGADPIIQEVLINNLDEVQAPAPRGGIAVALGLARCTEAADRMLNILRKERHQEQLAGYLSIGLALMGADAQAELRSIVQRAVRQPELLQQSAIALGKLGDKQAGKLLLEQLGSREDPNPSLAKMSAIAQALGYIGDHKSVTPLIELLENRQLTDLSRAFAAAALGNVADKQMLPWNAPIGVGTNYRASVPTLTDRQAGILDIL